MERGPRIPRACAAEGGSFFRVGELGNNRELRKQTYGRDCRRELFEIAECLQNEKIHATFFERLCLLSKNFPGLSGKCLAHLSKDPQWADRAGDQNLMLGCFPSLA